MQKRRIHLTRRVGYLVGIGIFAKFFVDTSIQLFNPFLLIYAGGIGVGSLTMGRLISLRNLSGLIAPVIGNLADRHGYRLLMRINLLLAALGILLFSMGENLWLLYIGMVIWGAGQGGFGPNVHSYLSSLLPYHQRSKYLGILEYSWAFAGIIGLFLIGLVIETGGWKLPLYLLAGGLIASAMLVGTLPGNREEKATAGGGDMTGDASGDMIGQSAGSREQRSEEHGSGEYLSPVRRALAFFHLGLYQRSAWGAVLVNLFNFFALLHIMIIHGAYLAEEFSMTPAGLGTVALLMGLFDWAGSILVSLAGDKIGKRKSVMIGTAGMLCFFLLLPFSKHGLPLALIGLILPRFFFEFATVSNFPLLSEQFPAQRGKIISLGVAGGLVGTTIAAVTGPEAYVEFGLWGLGPVSAVATVFSMLLLIFFVREQPYGR